MRSFGLGIAVLLGGVLGCGVAWGQDAGVPATTTLHAEARLVAIPVVVRDKKGALIGNLGKDDFALTVDGQAKAIRYFDRDDHLPLTLGLLVDTSMSQRAVLDEERTASTTFLEQMLVRQDAPAATGAVADRAFVLQFAHEAELLQDVTESKPKLQAALKEIDSTGGRGQNQDQDPPQESQGGGGHGHGSHGGHGGGGGYGHGGTVLYDAVYLSGKELMAKQKGRKALIVLSDGDDRGSKESLARAIEAAQRADTVVYAIYFKGEEHGGGGFGGYGGGHGGHGGGGGGGEQVDGKKVLERMCEETGGRLFEVKGKQTVATIYTQIGEELRTQYRLGYSPSAADAEEGYHKIAVTVPQEAKDRVQVRDGYYTGAVAAQ